MKKQEKINLVNGLRKDLNSVSGIVAVDFTGLKMDEITEVRQRIKESGGNFRVFKNSLIKIACSEGGLKDLTEFLEGPTALGWHPKEISLVSKILVESAKKYERMRIKGGIVEGAKVSKAEVEKIASLPSRKELLGQLAGSISAQPRQFLYLLQSLTSKMAQLLLALRDKKTG